MNGLRVDYRRCCVSNETLLSVASPILLSPIHTHTHTCGIFGETISNSEKGSCLCLTKGVKHSGVGVTSQRSILRGQGEANKVFCQWYKCLISLGLKRMHLSFVKLQKYLTPPFPPLHPSITPSFQGSFVVHPSEDFNKV